MRKFLVFLVGLSAVATLGAETVTLPAAASIVGGAPFFSDVRAFNTSYTNPLDVTATYHCFIPAPCNAGQPSITFTLQPRESQAFNDIVATTFQAPDTAGGVEFEFSGEDEQLVVTSRLYSTAPEPTVGMFIPALPNGEAHETTVLTSIRNGGANAGFRTNVGAYNREDSAITVTFRIFDGGNPVGDPVVRNVAGHSGVQVSGIFGVAGQGGHSTENAVIVVSSTGPIFSYAAVIDNNTTDPIFVVGAADQPFQATTPVATATPGAPTATPSPTATVAAPTVTPTPQPSTVNVTVGSPTDRFSPSTVTIQVGTTVHWTWAASNHSVTSTGGPDTYDSGIHNSGFTFDHTFNTPGTSTYLCVVHGVMMSGTVNVTN